MRKVLPVGTVITLDGNNYVVDQIIGTGASCVAYEGRKLCKNGSEIRCRIKECYPYDVDVVRNGTAIVWNSANQREQSFVRFRNGYRILNELRNQEMTGNSITGAELIEDNGSLYSIMEINYGTTLDKDDHLQLRNIIDLFVVLTKSISNLHEQGYLHLDLKPENILVSYDPTPFVWLFDTDTVVRIDDLKGKNNISIPYSPSWAAPEQLRRQTGNIGFWTDVFAIGAILYSKIYGHPPRPEDTNPFSVLVFPEAIEGVENPRALRLLKQVLSHALTAGIYRRYQSVSEMHDALVEISDILHAGKPYIKSNLVTVSGFFTGRKKEIKEIRERFDSDAHYVFVHGYGGIGKSELVKHYAFQYRDCYDCVLFIRYKGSLNDSIQDIQIRNFDGTEKEKYDKLIEILGESSLVIIDNFDVLAEKKNELSDMIESGADVLITTRTDFSGIVDKKHLLDLDVLSTIELTDIYEYYSKCHIIDEPEQKALKGILKDIAYHTYAVELLARHAAFSGLSVLEVAEELKNGVMTISKYERVLTEKDNEVKRESVPVIIRVLFRLSSLSVRQKQVLRNLSFLDFMIITKKIYIQEMKALPKDIIALNDLIELGLVRVKSGNKGEMLELHPLILETIKVELKPSLKKCTPVYAFIKREMDCYNWPDWDELNMSLYHPDRAVKYEYESRCSFFLHFFASCDMTEDAAIELFNHWSKKFTPGLVWEGEPSLWRSPEITSENDNDYISISEKLRGKKRKTEGLFYAQLTIFYAWLLLGGYTFAGKDHEKKNMLRFTYTNLAFLDCLNTAEKLQEYKEYYIRDLLSAVVTASRECSDFGISEMVMHKSQELARVYVRQDQMEDFSELFEEEITEVMGPESYNNALREKNIELPKEKELSLKEQYIERFNNEEKRMQILLEIINDTRLNTYDILDTIDSCFCDLNVSTSLMFWPDERVEKYKKKDFTSYNQAADFAYNYLIENVDHLLINTSEKGSNTDIYLDALCSYFDYRLITACIAEDRDTVDTILNHQLRLLWMNYKKNYLGEDPDDLRVEPFTMMPFFSLLTENIYNTTRINYATIWTVVSNIDALEIQRRIPEKLSPAHQNKIDRILIEKMMLVRDHIDIALKLLQEYPDELAEDQITKIKLYKELYKKRIDEIVDMGYEIKENPDAE